MTASADARLDGSYYVEGRTVRCAPLASETPSGRSISLGFPVCELSEWVSDEAAQIIAEALNEAQRRAALVAYSIFTRSGAP